LAIGGIADKNGNSFRISNPIPSCVVDALILLAADDGQFLLWCGGGVLAVVVVWGVVTLIRGRYYIRGTPEYLKQYELYLVKTSLLKGIVAGIVGTLILLVGFAGMLLCVVASHSDNLGFILVGMLTGFIGPILMIVGRRLIRRNAVTVLRNDKRPPILYLRSFGSDASLVDRWLDLFYMMLFAGRYETHEQSLTKALADIGPLIAIGKPNDLIPPIGATRLYVSHDKWQEVVQQLVAASKFVILRLGPTEGFWWELQHVAERCKPSQVLIFLTPEDRYRMYQVLVARGPEILKVQLPRHCGNALFLGFGPKWEPRLYGIYGPSIFAKFRRLLIGSPAPAIREALRPALWELGLPTRKMPLHWREWMLVGCVLAPPLFITGMIVWFFVLGKQ
jgi:hypothetical protein